jgi:phosphoribosyl-ATP pyrophosphohydrolase
MDAGYLKHLYDIVLSRKSASPETSYIAALYAKGRKKIAQKVGEEGVETAMAGVMNDRNDIINESADLLFHLLILLADANIPLEDVLSEMQRREGTSGLEEKALRKLTKE